MRTEAVPTKFELAVSTKPLRAPLASVSEAVKAMLASLLPSPWLKLNPLVDPSVRTPFELVSEMLRELLPASTSAILNAVAPLNVNEPSSLIVWFAGTVWTGASFTRTTSMVRVCVFELASPSLTVNVTVRWAVSGLSASVF